MRYQRLITTAALLLVAASAGAAQRVHNAAADGNVAQLQAVLSCDGDLVHATDHMGATPLHLAALEGHIDVVELLLREGSPPNATEAHGLTPLHYAVLRGQETIVSLLLAAGADANFRSSPGAPTPLEVAVLADAFRGTTALTTTLLKAGGVIDPERTAAGLPSSVFTAHLAGNLDMVRLLHAFLSDPDGTEADDGGTSATN
jgi:ankyrin repeat protein